MKHFSGNPRIISRTQFERLKDTLERLGDLSGIVHDLSSDQIVGGNQRVRALDLTKFDPVIVKQYETPTRTGTVAEGYYEIAGEHYGYRAVRWTDEQCREANITANIAGGNWDWDILAAWDADDLEQWGLDAEALAAWNNDAANMALLLETATAIPAAEPPDDFKEYDEDIKTEFCCPKCGYKWSGGVNLTREDDGDANFN